MSGNEWKAIKCSCGEESCHRYRVGTPFSFGGLYSKEEAQIMASGKELLEACENSKRAIGVLVDSLGKDENLLTSYKEILNQVQQAISKARGE